MSSSSSNKQPMMVDRPATAVTLLIQRSGQSFATSLVPASTGNAVKIFDVDSSLTDTSISGAYIDEIWFQYSKQNNQFIDAVAPTSGTYSANGTSITVTISGGHTVQVGQKVFLNITSYSSGTDPVDQAVTITAVTPTTFTGTIPSVSGPITGNVDCYLPVEVCFYLVNTAIVTNTSQFYPVFVANISSVYENQNYSLTLNNILPLINHPVVQAGSNFSSANSTVSPKTRGLMLTRGQALYAAASGTGQLANGFYVGVQAGYY